MNFRFTPVLRKIPHIAVSLVLGASSFAHTSWAQEARPSPGSAKALFGAVGAPTNGPTQSIGFYAKGCLAGAVALPVDGPNWQAMRLSRNRRWGNPQMIELLEQLSRDAAQQDGWPGLLVGDISQPRGGPMLNGHSSHQIGLDADIWLTPMPSHLMSAQEREKLPFTSMLQKNKFLTVDPRIWTVSHARLIMRAASYPQVERIFVNPAIKKKLCESWKGDRTALGKVRPYYGHDSHFHIRMHCPAGATNCKPQAEVPDGDGCGDALAWWYKKERWAPAKPNPNAKPVKPRDVMVSDLPKICAAVLKAAPVIVDEGLATPAFAEPPAQDIPSGDIPFPEARPLQ